MKSTKRRDKKPDHLGHVVSTLPRFLAGMLAMPPFLLLDNLIWKAFLTALFALMAVLAGKRIRWPYFFILGFSICFFHLLAPFGRVLLELGPLTITAGALENGVVRALTMTGMVFLSLAAVRPELELPGRLGGLLGRTFYHFENIIDGKAELSRKDFFQSLDRLLLERFDPREEDFGHGKTEDSGRSETKSQGKNINHGWLAAIIFILIPWFLWIVSLSGFPWL